MKSRKSIGITLVLVTLTIVFLVFALLNFEPAAAQHPESWPQWRFNAAKTGFAPDNTPPAKGDTIWKTFVSGLVFSSPAVVDGKVYFGNNNDINHSDYAFVWCLDADDGSVIWKYQLPNQGPGGEETHFGISTSSPAVITDHNGGLVFIGSLDHNFYCLDANDGTLVWKYETGARVYSSPCVTDSLVYFGSEDNNVYCFDFDGNVVWTYNVTCPVYSSPAVSDGLLYIGTERPGFQGGGGTSDGGTHLCLNASDGSFVWQKVTSSSVASTPCLGEGKMFDNPLNNRQIECYDALTGDSLWNFTVGQYTQGSLSYGNSRIYGGGAAGGASISMFCVNVATGGRELWSYSHSFTIGPSSPGVAGNSLIQGSQDNWVHCVNIADGTRIWRSEQTGGWTVSSPAIANGMAYCGSYDGYMYCFGDAAGAEPIVVAANDCLPPPPAIIFNAAIVALVAIASIGTSLSLIRKRR